MQPFSVPPPVCPLGAEQGLQGPSHLVISLFSSVGRRVFTFPPSEPLTSPGKQQSCTPSVVQGPGPLHGTGPYLWFFLSTVTAPWGWAIKNGLPSLQCFKFTHPLVPFQLASSLSERFLLSDPSGCLIDMPQKPSPSTSPGWGRSCSSVPGLPAKAGVTPQAVSSRHLHDSLPHRTVCSPWEASCLIYPHYEAHGAACSLFVEGTTA